MSHSAVASPTPRTSHAPLPLTALAPLLFASGAAALVYEVLWARDWALWYGATATGTAVVLAAYFAGLALGSALGGRVVPGVALRRWAMLEVGVAASVVGYLAVRPGLPSIAAWLSHVVAPPVVYGESLGPPPQDELEAVASPWLVEQAARVEGAESVLLHGHPASAVCAWALESRSDLLVAGAHRGRVARLALGSFAGYLAYHAPCPVLLVRPAEP